METDTPVAEVTRRSSLRRAMVLSLFTGGLVLFWWLLAVTAAQADTGRGLVPDERQDGAPGLVGGTLERTLAPVRQAPVARTVLRTATDSTRTAVDTVNESPLVRALPPAADPVLAVVDEVVTPALEAADTVVGEPPTDDTSRAEDPAPTPDPSRVHRPSAGLSATRAAELPMVTLLGATAGAVSATAVAPTTLASPAAVSPGTAAAATQPEGSTPARTPWSGPPANSPDTGGSSSLAVVADHGGTHGLPVVWIENPRRQAPPSLPAREPGSTPD